MRGLRLCCKGIGDDINFDFESKPKDKIIVPERTESCHKPRDASVIPPKRKCVKKMVCSCFIEYICGKSLNTKTNTKAVYGPGNYGKQSKGTICNRQMK